MDTILGVLVIVGIVTVAGGFFLLHMRLDRASRRRLARRYEAWRAGGCVGPEPEPRWLLARDDATYKTTWYNQ